MISNQGVSDVTDQRFPIQSSEWSPMPKSRCDVLWTRAWLTDLRCGNAWSVYWLVLQCCSVDIFVFRFALVICNVYWVFFFLENPWVCYLCNLLGLPSVIFCFLESVGLSLALLQIFFFFFKDFSSKNFFWALVIGGIRHEGVPNFDWGYS